MPKFLDQITALDTELQQTIDGSEHQIALSEYDVISNKLLSVQGKLCKVNLHNDVLFSNSEEFDILNFTEEEEVELNNINLSFQNLISTWNELDYKLRQDTNNTLTTTLALLDSVINSISNKHKLLWTSWVSELKNSFEVSDVMLDTQKNIPHLSAIYSDFVKDRNQFNILSDALPESKVTIKEVKALATNLNSLYNNMEFDLPEGVQKLFNELSRGFNNAVAPLRYLTPEVISWLEENNEIDNFVVKRK
ncbi:hypothetical protein [Thalassotalea crassostreae]|uniref:hypothetical protein n=1 Tax=Thalassotalea crassostreae TaxID=1763536 RepID=UPI000838B5E8|nr:hypothetical protein [Thalassotalea crassostreae]